MLRGTAVVARTEVTLALPPPREFVPLPPPAPLAQEPSRLRVAGQKYKAPQTRMSQAGVSWSLTDRVSLQLSYERTAYAPTMAKDHDDGILTGVKLGF
jgi:outer membrane receptor protein involved in Fe transport